MEGNEVNNDVLVELTNKTLEAADISKLNLNKVSDVEITETEKLPIITLEYAGGLRDISHNMAFAPVPDSLATKRAILDILGQIDLQQLCVNLEATSTLMDIAYNACNGIVGAHQKLYELRTDVYQATVRSVKLADEFSSVSENILSALVKVYKLIASGNAMKLRQVGTYLSRISGLAEGMSEAAAKMAKDFDDLSDRTLKQGSEVVAVENENIRLKEDMEKQLQEFKAKLDAFNASKKEIEHQIEEAQTLYTKYDDEARRLNKKADAMEIAGMVIGGIGSIVGSVGTALSGFAGSAAAAAGGAGEEAGGDASEEAEKAEEKLPELEQSEDVKKHQARLGSNKAELKTIEVRLEQYEQKIEALEKEKDAKEDSEKESGAESEGKGASAKKRANEEIDKEIEDIKEKRSIDSKRKAELTRQISDDDAYLKGKMASQMGMSVESASRKFGEKFDNCSANARSAAIAKEKLAEEILKLKFELQKKNAENEAMIAEFTRRIKNMNLDAVDLSVAITSLQLAVTCLSTVGSILANVSVFWSRVELSLKNLAGDVTLEALQKTLQDPETSPEELADYAKTDDDFLRDWYIMESKWLALQIVCEAYNRSCENAKDRLDISLRRAETEGLEHWKLAQTMAAEMEEKLKINLRSSESKTADFKKKIEIMEKSREGAYRDLLGEKEEGKEKDS
ncbi:MAG: hypothetical protein K2N80_02125 [Lachnospiraceae bacterium]|nr:hypothetical protein [Lachnospiraceae bacterium]